MRSTTSLISKIKDDYPQYTFAKCDKFAWSPPNNTIYYNEFDKNCLTFLLHELSHAILGHTKYDNDIQLLNMECKAWDNASKLATTYNVQPFDEIAQSNLDSYRDWMHKRSSCPNCNANGVQIKHNCYKCLSCSNEWIVNEARTCYLRRYKSPK